MIEQITEWVVVLAIFLIVLGAYGCATYLFLTGPEKWGKLKTSAVLSVVVGSSTFLSLLIAFRLTTSPPTTIIEYFTIPTLLAFVMALITLAGTYILQVGETFWKKPRGKRPK